MFKIEQVGNGIGFSNVLDTLLRNRGIENPGRFLNVSENDVEDFNKFVNIHVAGGLILEAIYNKHKIGILTDSDHDGYSSAALMYNYLKRIDPTLDIEYFIHYKKSHGLTEDIMNRVKNTNIKTLIIPDAASDNFAQHKELYKLGVTIIILDHHECAKYSEYACVVNNQMSPDIKDKSLTGVGVVYKMCKWLDKELKVNYADDYLDLVAMGMISDHADLHDFEARYLVLEGIKQINEGRNRNKFITKIFENKKYSLGGKCSIIGMGFYMCPAVNCVIRGGDYETKVNLFKAFIGVDEKFEYQPRGKNKEPLQLSVEDYMIKIYGKLKRLQDKNATKGVELLSKQVEDFGLDKYEIMVVNGNSIPKEIGSMDYNRVIINKLANKYDKNVLLLFQSDKSPLVMQGSGAGLKHRKINNLKQWCTDSGLFTYASGHANAFGCGMFSSNINTLYNTIATIPSDEERTYRVDAIFTDKSLNKNVINLVGSYSDIWGNGLETPLFAVKDIVLNQDDIHIQGKNQDTLKFIYKDVEFIKFRCDKDELAKIVSQKATKFTLIGTCNLNIYDGNNIAQFVIDDMMYEETTPVNSFRF